VIVCFLSFSQGFWHVSFSTFTSSYLFGASRFWSFMGLFLFDYSFLWLGGVVARSPGWHRPCFLSRSQSRVWEGDSNCLFSLFFRLFRKSLATALILFFPYLANGFCRSLLVAVSLLLPLVSLTAYLSFGFPPSWFSEKASLRILLMIYLCPFPLDPPGCNTYHYSATDPHFHLFFCVSPNVLGLKTTRDFCSSRYGPVLFVIVATPLWPVLSLAFFCIMASTFACLF